MLPGLGRDWAQIIASLSTVCLRTNTHAMEWEAVPARCVADDHTLLQPAELNQLAQPALVRRQPSEANCREEGARAVRPPPVSSAPRVVVRQGGCARARAKGRVAATRRLGVTSGTSAAATGALFAAGGAKEPAAENT